MASEVRSSEMILTEAEQESAQGLLDNRNGSEDLVLNEETEAFQAAPENVHETLQPATLRSPRHEGTQSADAALPVPSATPSSWWQRTMGRSGDTTAGVTVRPRREPARQQDELALPSPAPSPPLSPRALGDQLAALRQQADIAEVTARIVAAELAAAQGRRQTAEHLLVAHDLRVTLSLRSRSTSPTGSLVDQTPSGLPPPPPTDLLDRASVVPSLDDDQWSSAEARQRDAREQRQEARAEARWQEERADRRAEVQAAADREDRRAAIQAAERQEDREQALRIAALGRAPHRLGVALTSFRRFDGADGADGAAYLAELTALLGTHAIPPEMRAKEFYLKLTGKAADWFASEYDSLPPGECPAFGVMCSAFLHEFSPRYQAATAYQALHSATRQSGTTGPEALASLATLELRLRRLGVENPGVNEQLAYRLQNLLSAQELQVWMSLANAIDISDVALNELELHSTSGTLSRHSCSPETREAFFLRRGKHLRCFLRDQSRASPCSRTVGPAPARAAVIVTDDAGPPPARDGVVPPLEAAGERARLAAVEQWNTFQARDDAPPEYFGSNKIPKNLAANKASVIRRGVNKACWRCPEDRLVAGQPHWECRFHGVNALAADAASCPTVPGTSHHVPRTRR
jgi:hypothetical protein